MISRLVVMKATASEKVAICSDEDTLMNNSSEFNTYRDTDNNKLLSLLTLPADVLRRILWHADVWTLGRLAQTNTRLRDEVRDDELWREQAIRRFRVTRRTTNSRRLQAAGGVSWRTLYANWHAQLRMPMSRFSGPAINAFAKGSGAGACAWLTVNSTDDCKVMDCTLRVRVVVQNICASELVVPASLAFYVQNVGLIVAGQRSVNGCFLRIVDLNIQRAHGSLNVTNLLHKDDFVIIFAQLRIHGTIFEIDALERLSYVAVPVIADGKCDHIVCKTSDRQIWDSYELLPGGWWARIG